MGVAVRAELRRPGLSGGRGGRPLDGAGAGAAGGLTATGDLTGAATGLAAGLAGVLTGVLAGALASALAIAFAGAAALAFTTGAVGVFFNVTFDAGLPAALVGLTGFAALTGNGFLGVALVAAGLPLAAVLATALIGVDAFFTTLEAGLGDDF